MQAGCAGVQAGVQVGVQQGCRQGGAGAYCVSMLGDDQQEFHDIIIEHAGQQLLA